MSKVMLFVFSLWLLLAACSTREEPAPTAAEEETLSRTEFTDRVENFFEYTPLRTGKPSQFLIHLTDLVDGSPVEKADVTLLIRPAGTGEAVAEVKALVGRVTGIYVAEVSLKERGEYNIEFHIRNSRLDERMVLDDFSVE